MHDHTVPEIDVDQLETLLAAGATVIDVREPHEYTEARIAGVRLVPLETVPEQVDQFPREGPVYLVCAMGGRSFRAAEFLRGQGVDAVNVAGGTKAWIEAGKPFQTG
ncbi:MAG: rhodanese-like domain-containing protein [Acidimicrobiia bacterium]|nr:rhodanese-like domain-containing protein [Acidimicrobiia bacterium]MDH5236044.1 rhodanese-like domain-containing protein [Acidimicrobiia bacterium]